jgi:glycosidase
MTDLIDPNLDIHIGSNLQKFEEVFENAGAELFWYDWPCSIIDGADIIYHDNNDGQWTGPGINQDYHFETGEPKNKVDLRIPANQQRLYDMLDFIASNGVQGFYFDASACPGDEEFFDYAKAEFSQRYGLNYFIMEGARDRSSLKFPQVPLLKLPNMPESHSVLIDWLVPYGTYYGGVFNNVMTNEEIDEIISKGYQPIISNSLGTSDTNYEEHMALWKGWMCDAYVNQYERWLYYGSSIGCSQPQQPSYC